MLEQSQKFCSWSGCRIHASAGTSPRICQCVTTGWKCMHSTKAIILIVCLREKNVLADLSKNKKY